MHAIQLRLGINTGHAQHGKALGIQRHFFIANKQIAHKKLMPSQLVNKMHRQAIVRICTCVNIGYIHFVGSSIVQHFFIKAVKGFLAAGLIIIPAQLLVGVGVIYKKFILGWTACMLTSYDTQRSIGSQHSLMISQSLLHKLFSRQIKNRQLHSRINFLAQFSQCHIYHSTHVIIIIYPVCLLAVVYAFSSKVCL